MKFEEINPIRKILLDGDKTKYAQISMTPQMYKALEEMADLGATTIPNLIREIVIAMLIDYIEKGKVSKPSVTSKQKKK